MKIDRRKQRTRALLRDALIALILEKGYDAVTVQEITDRANLGRATFYLHYNDKDDLLLNMMEEIQGDLLKEAKAPVEGDAITASPTFLAFKHAEDNADFYRAILGKSGLDGVLMRYRKASATQLQAWMSPLLPPGSTTIPLEILSNYLIGAFDALVLWWLENDRPYPAEEMAQIFQQLIKSGVEGTLNTAPALDFQPR